MMRPVKNLAERERRQYPRFPQVLEVHARSLSSIPHGLTLSEMDCQGRIQNVSDGGMCLLSPQPLPAATFVLCAISLPDTPVAIPTLMQVRWTSRRGHKSVNFISGLRFVTS